jgi:hypothetical protein
MTNRSQGADSGLASESQAAFQEFVVKRDKDGPFSFAGVQLAKASRQTSGLVMSDILEAAVYRTRGGKFVTSLSKIIANPFTNLFATAEDISGPDAGYHKAAAHDTFEAAMSWFRPGRLTDEIRRQLGLDKPVRLE